MCMLTNEEKMRLRAEEEFRDAVRREFAEASGKHPNRALAFFNTPLGLWLLGTVAVGLLTWVYQASLAFYKERQEQRAQVSRISTELRERIDATRYVLAGAEQMNRKDVNAHLREMAPVILDELNGRGAIAYTEYRALPATALFARLRDLDDDVSLENAQRLCRHIDISLRRDVPAGAASASLTFRSMRENLERVHHALPSTVQTKFVIRPLIGFIAPPS